MKTVRQMLSALSIVLGGVAYAAPDAAGKIDRREAEVAEARKVEASALALDAVSREAEKNYRAALSGSARGDRRAAQPTESVDARRALNDLELALAHAPAKGSLDRSARRFATAAEALLLRAREPARRSGDGGLEQTASLQSLLAAHELFQDAAAHLRIEVEKAVGSRALIEAMRGGRERRDSDKR